MKSGKIYLFLGCLISLVLVGNVTGAWESVDVGGWWPGGTAVGNVKLLDDQTLTFGTDNDYDIVFDPAQIEFNSTDCNGSGTDCVWMSVDNGTDDVDFTGDLHVGANVYMMNGTMGMLNAANGDLMLYADSGNRVRITSAGLALANADYLGWNASAHGGSIELILQNVDAGKLLLGNAESPTVDMCFDFGTSDVYTTVFQGDCSSAQIWRSGPQTETIDDDAGGTHASATLTPTSNFILCDCDDAHGCTITMGETGMASGIEVTIVGETATHCDFADTDGVQNLSAAFEMSDDDVLKLVYSVDEWVEVSQTNN